MRALWRPRSGSSSAEMNTALLSHSASLTQKGRGSFTRAAVPLEHERNRVHQEPSRVVTIDSLAQ